MNTKSFTVLLLVALPLSSDFDLMAQRIDTVPAASVSAPYLQSPRPRRLPNITHLRRQQSTPYTLDAGDTLAIFVDGVLGPVDSNPPVQFPPPGSDLPPSLGYPIVVRENGQIDLPHVAPINVRGLTVEQTTKLVKRAYQQGEAPILKPGKNRILVSLMRKRTYRVTVIRQNQNRPINIGNQPRVSRLSDQSATGNIIELPAGENDVLNALIRTGGLPGVNEKPEVRVQRGTQTEMIPSHIDGSYRNAEFPRSATASHQSYRMNLDSSLSIPVRLAPGQTFDRRASELRDGDVVSVDSRQSEIFYTGGLLNGGQHLIPRDSDLDVLEAVAMVGRRQTTARNPAQPTELIVLRRLSDNRQIPIRVDLDRALTDPRERILVAPGDTLLLRYKPVQRAVNFGSAVFNTYGIGRLGR